MKFARSSVMLLSGTGLALAGRNASQATYQEMPPQGPGVRCSSAIIWGDAQKTGDTLSEARASSFVTDFNLVDAHSDGIISETDMGSLSCR